MREGETTLQVGHDDVQARSSLTLLGRNQRSVATS